jgi:hypothetical protein
MRANDPDVVVVDAGAAGASIAAVQAHGGSEVSLLSWPAPLQVSLLSWPAPLPTGVFTGQLHDAAGGQFRHEPHPRPAAGS